MKTVVSKQGNLVLVDWIPMEETDKMGESRGDVDYCKIGYDREYYLLNQPYIPIHPKHTDYFTPYIGKEIPDEVWEMETEVSAGFNHSEQGYEENVNKYAIPKQPEGDVIQLFAEPLTVTNYMDDATIAIHQGQTFITCDVGAIPELIQQLTKRISHP